MAENIDVQIPVKCEDENLLPTKKHATDACWDIHAAENVILLPNSRVKIPTGIYLGLPTGWEAQIRPRSGLASDGFTILNTPGTIDAGYRGEVKVIAYNTAREQIEILYGQRIAQMCIQRIPAVQFAVVDELDSTDRGANGFGSTG